MTALREAFVGIEAANIGEIDASPDSMKRLIGQARRQVRPIAFLLRGRSYRRWLASADRRPRPRVYGGTFPASRATG